MLILTPNRRLAAFLTRQHNAAQIAAGKTCWETPQIIPLEAWFTQLWQVCIENSNIVAKPILNKIQQQLLWEKIIASSNVGVELLRIAPTAKNTLQAWKFLRQWRVSVKKLASYAAFSADTAAFYEWLQSYLSWLQQNEYLDFDLMIDALTDHVAEFAHKLPREMHLIGVDDPAPQFLHLLKVIADQGIQISYASMTQPGATVLKHGFIDSKTELDTVAQWAKDLITNNGNEIIGIVIPELEQKRQEIVRIFGSYIPQHLINISAPASMASITMIDHALLILQLNKNIINFSDFSILLRSPYITGQTEQDLRARLDRALRETVESKLSWETLTRQTTDVEFALQTVITKMPKFISTAITPRSTTAWVEFFTQLLTAWGWPGERGLTASDADLLTCWYDLLQTFSNLSMIDNTFTYAQALQLLQRLAIETPFAAAETGATRVHILGVLEATGIAFDHLWVTGMDRDSWPPDAAPNPFIPQELQRQVDMPRSSPQRELKVARRLTATLAQGGKIAVHFSYPQVFNDHVTTASNLLQSYPEQEFKNAATVLSMQPTELESIADYQGPVVSNTMVRGGTGVLKLQAQCPFKAFAEIRLQAQPLAEPQLILDASERGKLVHEVLEEFWRQCGTQQQLQQWLPNVVTTVLQDLTTKVLQKLQTRKPITLNENYVQLEKTRLIALITRWLQYELQRAPFTVYAIEQKIQVSLGPLLLSVRADRIDQLADGSLVLIDYKTGIAQFNDWSTDPIIEPQMPLYAISNQDQVAAVVYANVQPQPDKMKFSGVAVSGDMLLNVKILDEWDLQLNTWRIGLQNLADNFVNGIAKVQVFSIEVCKKCKLQALCRIYDC